MTTTKDYFGIKSFLQTRDMDPTDVSQAIDFLEKEGMNVTVVSGILRLDEEIEVADLLEVGIPEEYVRPLFSLPVAR